MKYFAKIEIITVSKIQLKSCKVFEQICFSWKARKQHLKSIESWE